MLSYVNLIYFKYCIKKLFILIIEVLGVSLNIEPEASASLSTPYLQLWPEGQNVRPEALKATLTAVVPEWEIIYRDCCLGPCPSKGDQLGEENLGLLLCFQCLPMEIEVIHNCSKVKKF